MKRRQWLAAAMATFGIGLTGKEKSVSAEEDDIESKDRERESDLTKPEDVNWDPLVEWYRVEGGRWIESIDVDLTIREFDGRKELPLQKYKFQISAEKSLKLFESISHHPFAPLRVVTSSNSGGACGGGATLGTLRVNATGRSFFVGVTRCGFCLKNEADNVKQRFFSYAWSYALDEAVFANSGNHLPLKIVTSLSGEMKLQEERELVFSGGMRDLPKEEAVVPVDLENWTIEFDGLCYQPRRPLQFHVSLTHDGTIRVEKWRGMDDRLPILDGKLSADETRRFFDRSAGIINDHKKEKSDGNWADAWNLTLAISGEAYSRKVTFKQQRRPDDKCAPGLSDIVELIRGKLMKGKTFPE